MFDNSVEKKSNLSNKNGEISPATNTFTSDSKLFNYSSCSDIGSTIEK